MPNLQNTAFIGGYYLHGWHGRLPNLQYLNDTYARIGQTGSGSQSVGRRGETTNISAWAGAASRVEAIALADGLEAMQSQTAVVGDDFGRVFQRVRIEKISASIHAGYGPTLPSGVQMLFRIDVTATMEVLP